MYIYTYIYIYIYIKNMNVNMIYYDIINVSEGTDVNKTRKSKGCDNCHYWYFLDEGFRF